jgi:CRP-like cAMP-binding protein
LRASLLIQCSLGMGNMEMLSQSDRRSPTGNTILSRLPAQELATVRPFLKPVVLRERMVLQEPRRPVDHVYFLESGLVSLRVLAAGTMLETAVAGHRCVVGASSLMGMRMTTYQSVVLIPGSALIISVEDLLAVIDERPLIGKYIELHAEALVSHGAQSALCGVRHSLEQRLACWLCLACDALDSGVLPVTHDYLSAALGLRRAGVTETLIQFERHRLIRKMRGVLEVDDRKRLAQRACVCYAVIASGYAALEHGADCKEDLDRQTKYQRS